MRSRVIGLATAAVLVSMCLGCGEPNPLNRQAVSGTVTFNGKPLAGGGITIMPLSNDATMSGSTITDGKFVIGAQQGVAPGEYAVTLNIFDPDWTPDKGAEALPVTPPDWATGSAHKITVKEGGPNEFTFDVVNDKPPVYKKKK